MPHLMPLLARDALVEVLDACDAIFLDTSDLLDRALLEVW